MKYLICAIITVCLFSCFGGLNLKEAKRVSENFTRKYTGIDTLIRIDGYYYHEDGTRLPSPFMILNNGEFQILYVRYENHSQIQEKLGNDTQTARGKGNYTLSGDTIKVRWAMAYQNRCYEIFSEQYLIVNDTTLRRIWHLCELSRPYSGKKSDPTRNEIYKFYQYPVDAK